MAPKILIIDDEPDMVELLKQTLLDEGYDVEASSSALQGLRKAHAFQPDLVVLDVMMPEMNGWDVLRRLRGFCQVPVIMLTAVSTEEAMVQGLDLGADDYVTKPFGVRELKARIRATLRRAALPPDDDDQNLRFDDGRLIIDPATYRVSVQGVEVSLSPTEQKLLFYLVSNAGRVVTHEQILDQVWGPGYENSLANVKVYIRRLRCKIEPDPKNPRYIQTQRGAGYFLAKI